MPQISIFEHPFLPISLVLAINTGTGIALSEFRVFRRLLLQDLRIFLFF